jgi:hypothetical protein
VPFGLALLIAAAGCGRGPKAGGPSPAGTSSAPQAEPGAPASVGRDLPPAAAPQPAPSADQAVAGYIFDVPVPLSNYYFAKTVSYRFPHPWEEGLAGAERERAIWEALILHYESFRRGVSLDDQEMEDGINGVLRAQGQTFTRQGDPAAYAAWVLEKVGEDVALFENQMRYLFQIAKLKDQVREGFSVPVTEEEMQQEFLNEQHHVGGEMVMFDTPAEAQTFYEAHRDPAAWEAMKAAGTPAVRPVSLMTLEAYMDLWSIPKDQMYAFHGLEIGTVGPPMPFGPKQWCVYRLLDKRTGNLGEFPAQREAYRRQLTTKKQYEALKQWVEELKAAARLRVVLPDTPVP